MNQKKLDELRDYYDNTDTSAEIADAELDDEVVKSPMVGITVRLPAEVLQQVRTIASRSNVKTTALIRQWIEDATERDTGLPSAGGFLAGPFPHSEFTALWRNVDAHSFQTFCEMATRNAGFTIVRTRKIGARTAWK